MWVFFYMLERNFLWGVGVIFYGIILIQDFLYEFMFGMMDCFDDESII